MGKVSDWFKSSTDSSLAILLSAGYQGLILLGEINVSLIIIVIDSLEATE